MASDTKKRPNVDVEPDLHRAFSTVNSSRGITNIAGGAEALRAYVKKHIHHLPENQKERFLANA